MQVSTPDRSSPDKAGEFDGRVTEAANSTHSAIDAAASVADSGAQIVSTAIDRTAATGHEAVKQIEETAKPAERWVNKKVDALLAGKKSTIADTGKYIVANPWKSVGMAVSVGILFARITR